MRRSASSPSAGGNRRNPIRSTERLSAKPRGRTSFQISRLTLLIRGLLAGGYLLGIVPRTVQADLPVPANVLVAPGAGNVMAPVIAGNTMTIHQLSDQATLDWQSFNIGPGNTVRFEQPQSSSVALNTIHQADPSRILGTLTANGQVYLVNQNGFLFGQNAKVNANALIASSLDISQATLSRGLAQAFNNGSQPALAIAAEGHQPGAIVVEAGAQLATQEANGRIVLAAPSITNKGSITAPDGQIILAAAKDKVYLQQAGADSDVRGLVVEVGTGGDVSNLGRIMAERGNVSLMGFAVNQDGLVSASTSVKLNGSVRLLAREGFKTGADGSLLPGTTRRNEDLGDGLGQRARVTLGSGSLTEVALDTDKTATAVDAQLQNRSHLEISGHTLHLKSDAKVLAPSGQVDLTASDDPANPALRGEGRIDLDSGSRVDVSGVKNVSLPMSRNVISVELRSNELRDAPRQRDGILHGQTVKVDLRDVDAEGRIPIADVSGALARIERAIDERSTSGGTLNIRSSGDLIARPGSVLDVSGGSVAYRAGLIDTTQLLAGNAIFDIGHADPDRHYDGLLVPGQTPHTAWNLVDHWVRAGVSLARHESGYTEGKAGGTLNLAAYGAMLDGMLKGGTVNGIRQQTVATRTPASNLSIDLNQGNLQSHQAVVFASRSDAALVIQPDSSVPEPVSNPVTPPVLTLDPKSLARSGFGKLSLKTNDTLTLKPNTQLRLPENGTLDLAAAGFDIEGSIRIPGGTVSLAPISIPVDGEPLSQSSGLVLGRNAVISVAGNWVNDQKPGPEKPAPDGGTVNLSSEQQNLVLEPGSRIDASAGAWLDGNGTLHGGQGGAITLVAATRQPGQPAAHLSLNGSVEAYGVTRGGTLELASHEVWVGQPPVTSQEDAPLLLSPDFFQQGGFADYHITANQRGLTVADGTSISPRQNNLRLPKELYTFSSADTLPAESTVYRLPDDLRHPASITLTVNQAAEQNRESVLRIGRNADISVEQAGAIHLVTDTSIDVAGRLNAPAGQISLDIVKPQSGDHGFFASQSLWLEAGSQLSATGAFAPERNDQGLIKGQVLPGGSIALDARRGYLITDPDSSLDVSGTRHTVQFLAEADGTPAVSTQTLPSAGGSILLKAGEGILAAGQIAAHAGGAGVSGGSLAVELEGSGRSKPTEPIPGGIFPDDTAPDSIRSLIVSADSKTISTAGIRFGDELTREVYSGKGLVSADRINAAGVGSLTLKTDALNLEGRYVGSIRFADALALHADRSIVLDSPGIAFTPSTAGEVSLNAPYLALGSTLSRVDQLSGSTLLGSTLAPPAQPGSGIFSATAQGIDLIGGLSFDGFSRVNLTSQGDVRAIGIRQARETRNYLGELHLAGDLAIVASQFYPTTLSDYTVTLQGDSTLSLAASGAVRSPIYSAGGSLTLNAARIEQAGVLSAPLGQLQLNATQTLHLAPGSLTSVSGGDLTVPLGQGSGTMNWLYPLDSSGLINRLITTPPEKRLNLSGPDIRLDTGATLDLSGGGDLSAYEFITGPGGTRDVLAATDQHLSGFAVIPGVRGISTPYDPLEFAASGLKVGDSVYLGSGSGLAAGHYTLLPAHYALLPGAYWIRPEAARQDFLPGQHYQRLDGATVVAGRYQVADTALSDPRWQGFAVQPGQVARLYSEFRDYSANRFFAQTSASLETPVPRLPVDAGRLAVAAGDHLTLAATVLASTPQGGRGGDMDISAERLAIVGRREATVHTESTTGTVTLVADDLNRLGIASLSLGGLRSQDAQGEHLTVTAQSIELDGDAALEGRDFILAAQNTVSLARGAKITSTGTEAGSSAPLDLANAGTGDDDGALLRVSALPQIEVIRADTRGSRGVLNVAQGATLKAEGSILLDATQDTHYAGQIDIPKGALSLKSSSITIGKAAPNTPGLVIAAHQLAVEDLRLSSAGAIHFRGNTTLTNHSVTLDAATLEGSGGAGTVVKLNADTLRWFNSHAATRPSSGKATAASIDFDARRIELGQGDYALRGFLQATFKAGEELLAGTAKGSSDGRLQLKGLLTLDTPRFGGYDGASLAIESGNITLASPVATAYSPQADAGLGVKWDLSGRTISGVGRFDLPSGTIQLNAGRGDVQLDQGSWLDVSGRTVNWDAVSRVSPAGSVKLTAAQGAVVLNQGAKIDLSSPLAGGSLDIVSPQGHFIWAGEVTATTSLNGSLPRFNADVADWGSADFSSLSSRLAAAGFRGDVSVRQRDGSIILPADSSLQASHLSLKADQGLIDLEGRIDASGQQGGQVMLQGSRGITLGPAALIDAHATDPTQPGGEVRLDAVDSSLTGTASGSLNLAEGSRIDVSGGSEAEGGSVHFRTGRDDATGSIAISPIKTTMTGSQRTVLEVTRVYTGVARIDADFIEQLRSDTDTFMARAQIPSDSSGVNLKLQPGLDIRNNGNISLVSAWDFMAHNQDAVTGTAIPEWRYQGEPGVLSLAAGGDIFVKASLSDGFATASLPDPLGMILPDMPVTLRFQDVIQPGYSWSYRLKAEGDVVLAPYYRGFNPVNPARLSRQQVMLRTGTGDISIEAGSDLRFEADPKDPGAAAAVYTAGRPADYSLSDLLLGHIPGIAAPAVTDDLAAYLATLAPEKMAGLLRNGYFNEYQSAWNFVAEYPTQGGDVRLTAGHNITGIQTGQRVSDWQVRSGTWTNDPNDTGKTPTAWGLNLSGSTANETLETTDAAGQPVIVNVKGRHFFNQNVGALGGGDVSVTAGGTVADLAVMIPSTGKPMGIFTTPGNGGKPDLSPYAGLDTRWLANGTVVAGGGSLTVRAGSAIRGGEFYVDRGTGRLEAGDAILPADSGLATVTLLGDARFDIQSRQDLHFGTALNPTLLPQRDIPDFASGKTADFITYSPESAVNLLSTGGNLLLQSDLTAWKDIKGYSLDEENGFNLALYPGTLKATALTGDLRIEGSINLLPAPQGQLELFAGRNLGTSAIGNNTLAVNLSDADLSLFPSVDLPVTQLISNTPGTQLLNQLLDASNPDSTLIHAAIPVHVADRIPALVVAGSDIAVPDGGRLTFFLPKAADFEAGRDIRNISIYGQNLATADATLINTGRDLVFTTVQDVNGNVASLDQRIQVSGPGRLAITAGRTISLGGSSGVSSVGNLANPALPGGLGATLDLLAGMSHSPDYQGFFNQYLGADSPYLTVATHWPGLADYTLSSLSPEQRLAILTAAPTSVQRGLAAHILFQEIKYSAGAAAAAPEAGRSRLYQRGFTALETLFPDHDYAGDLSLVFSQIKSYNGGGINLLIPGGQVDVGLAGQVGGVQKSASQLGIVVQGAGDFNAYTQGNFNVNQSRVFTMGGGDIAIWSSQGSIDAGKGAKSAISAPPPVTRVDEKGNIVTIFPPIVSGSGIQAITPADANAQQGSVYLAAPAGTVNAGEAGISGGKVVIAASAVIGASNIQASGGTVGVPTAVAPPVIPSGVSGAAAGAAKAATQAGGLGDTDAAGNDGADEKGRKASSSLMTSEVVGYGSCSIADVRNGTPGCGG